MDEFKNKSHLMGSGNRAVCHICLCLCWQSVAKEFDLGLIGLIYSILFCLLWILFRKNRFKKEIALLASSGLLIIFYLVFL